MSEEKLTLGQYFRSEREKREITLKEIEQITKIPAQTLKFMEEDQIDVLPPRAFLRGFLQVISKEFDFDEEALIRHLDETLADHGKKEETKNRFKNNSASALPRWIFLMVLVLILIAVVGFSLKTCRETYQSSVNTITVAEHKGLQGEWSAG